MRFSRRRLLLATAVAAIALVPWTLEQIGVPASLGLGCAVGAGTALVAMLLRSRKTEALADV